MIAAFRLFCIIFDYFILLHFSFFSFYNYLCIFHQPAKICSKSYNWILFILTFLYLINFGADSCSLIFSVKMCNTWIKKNYSGRNNHIERILVAVKNIDHFFCMASELLESIKLRLFLLLDGTLIDDNKYLKSLENATELTVCTRNGCLNFWNKKIFAI